MSFEKNGRRIGDFMGLGGECSFLLSRQLQ